MILAIIALVFVFRLPGLYKTTVADFPGCNPATFETWKRKEIGSIYWLLIATWARLAVFFGIGLLMGLLSPEFTQRVITRGSTEGMIFTGIELLMFFILIIPAIVLSSQAAKLKKEFKSAAAMGPAGYQRAATPTSNMPAAPDLSQIPSAQNPNEPR